MQNKNIVQLNVIITTTRHLQNKCWNKQEVELQTMEGATLRVSGHHAMYTFRLRWDDAFADLLNFSTSPNIVSQWSGRSMAAWLQCAGGAVARKKDLDVEKSKDQQDGLCRCENFLFLLIFCSSISPRCPSHLDALHCLVNGLQQSPVLRVLVAVFVGEHAGESVYVAVEVLLRERFLLHTQHHTVWSQFWRLHTRQLQVSCTWTITSTAQYMLVIESLLVEPKDHHHQWVFLLIVTKTTFYHF